MHILRYKEEGAGWGVLLRNPESEQAILHCCIIHFQEYAPTTTTTTTTKPPQSFKTWTQLEVSHLFNGPIFFDMVHVYIQISVFVASVLYYDTTHLMEFSFHTDAYTQSKNLSTRD